MVQAGRGLKNKIGVCRAKFSDANKNIIESSLQTVTEPKIPPPRVRQFIA